MQQSLDIGPEILDRIYQRMQIDAEWSLRKEREFTWWGHRLAQRVSVDCPQFGDGCVRIHAETDFVRGIPPEANLAAVVNLLNLYTSLSAFVWDAVQRTVKLTWVDYLWPDEELIQFKFPLMLSAVAIQAAEAHRLADSVADMLQAEVDVTHHPVTGARTQPDDMLNVVKRCYVPEGQFPSRFAADDFSQPRDRINKWKLGYATSGEGGMTAEIPFSGFRPAILIRNLREETGEEIPVETTLLRVFTDQPHPVLGNGLLLALNLPLWCEDADTGYHIAARLNAAEALAWGPVPCYGAWSWHPEYKGVCHATFLPNLCWRAGLSWYMAIIEARRAAWARKFLLGEDN